MKILVCGGRNFDDYVLLSETLNDLHKSRPFHTIIHGAARGADSLAAQWAKENKVFAQDFPANWNQFGHRAGPIRNKEMLKVGKPDIVIAFPGGRGTSHMKNIARQAGVEVIEVDART